MTVYPNPPTFTAGQRLSASAHLQGITDTTGWLIGFYQQDQIPFEQRQDHGLRLDDAGVWQCFEGWIYHKQDELDYKFSVEKDPDYSGRIWIYLDEDLMYELGDPGGDYWSEVAAGTGSVTVTGTKDVSGADTGIKRVRVEYARYNGDVKLESRGELRADVVYLREVLDPSYASLATFADETTPTAAEWQELSDNADELHAQMSAPHRPMPGLVTGRPGGAATVWTGLITHQHDYFFYDIRIKAPTNERDPAHDYVFATFEWWIELNGTTIAKGGYYVCDEQLDDSETNISFFTRGEKLAEGDVIQRGDGEKILLGPISGDTDFNGCTRGYDGTEARATQYGSQWHTVNPDGVETRIQADGDDWDQNYSGVADLTSLGLTPGSEYTLEVKTNHDTHASNDFRSAIHVGLLSEQTTDLGISAWVEAMIGWSHGDYVIGTSGVKYIRDNLTELESRAVYQNYPCGKAHPDSSLWGVRRHRWLMYRHAEDVQPVIGYDGGPGENGWTEVNMATEANKWLSFDMASLAHFWNGMRYKVSGAEYAIEDTVPYAEE